MQDAHLSVQLALSIYQSIKYFSLLYRSSRANPQQSSELQDLEIKKESRMGVQGGRRSTWLQLMSLILMVSPLLFGLSAAQDCGASNPCQSGYCCSNYGYCGTSSDYCSTENCASQCPSPSTSSGIGTIVTSSLYDQIFPNRDPFYTYDSFTAAAASFPSIGTTGSSDQQKQDIAALFAHATHETSGLQYIRESNPTSDYCDSTNTQYPCASGQSYYGRGPLQLSWNYNYGPCGDAIGQDLLGNPDLVATDATVSWEAAMWFWTTAQSPKPACESVMDGSWTPSSADTSAGRAAGFGVTIDIINGGIECGPNAQSPGPDEAADRVTQYKNICDILGVGYGDNLDCTNMQPF